MLHPSEKVCLVGKGVFTGHSEVFSKSQMDTILQ